MSATWFVDLADEVGKRKDMYVRGETGQAIDVVRGRGEEGEVLMFELKPRVGWK